MDCLTIHEQTHLDPHCGYALVTVLIGERPDYKLPVSTHQLDAKDRCPRHFLGTERAGAVVTSGVMMMTAVILAY